MRRRLAIALPASLLVFGATALPALAAGYPTTPVPAPANPSQPPASVTQGPHPLGHAIADAGGAIGKLSIGSGLIPPSSILGKAAADQSAKQAIAEGGIGLSSAQVNSESYLDYEHSIAQSSPLSFAFEGNSPQTPGTLTQTALPDNPKAVTGGVKLPPSPLDSLLKLSLLPGSAHARYSSTLGPCVAPLSDAETSLANLSLLNLNVPGAGQLSNLADLLNPSALTKLANSGGSGSSLNPTQLKDAVSNSGLTKMLGLLAPGLGTNPAPATKTGSNSDELSLLALPDTINSHSSVALVPMKGSKNKAIQTTSTLQVADLQLFKNVPLMEIDIKVVSQPKLVVTSTGSAKTSTVSYTAPVFEVDQNHHKVGMVDARHPFSSLNFGVLPMTGSQANLLKGTPLASLLPSGTTGSGGMTGIPFLGNLSSLTSQLPTGSPATSMLGSLTNNVIDLGVLKFGFGELSKSSKQMVKGKDNAPYSGYQLGATAKLFDLQVLPASGLDLTGLTKLVNANGAGSGNTSATSDSSALLDLSFGEQVGRAYAPTGGVNCGVATPATPVATPPKAAAAPPLAYTNAAYDTVPIFWTGTALLLAGVILVAALPRRRRTSLRVPPRD
ncbi:MAG: hypothetical protein ACRDRL_33475 [Sciscionella sp.]